MPYFDRWDICDAYTLYSYGWNDGGYATGRREAYRGQTDSDITVRLSRMGYKNPQFNYTFDELSTNGQEIYTALVVRKEGVTDHA